MKRGPEGISGEASGHIALGLQGEALTRLVPHAGSSVDTQESDRKTEVIVKETPAPENLMPIQSKS